MKILVLNFNLRGVGTYQRSFYFSRELARHGHDVTMITVSRDSKYRSRAYYKRDWIGQADRPVGDGPWIRMIEGPNLGYKWLPGWGSGPLDIALRIREILEGDYDAVYGFEYHPNVSWPVYLTRPFMRYKFFSDWCDWFAGISNAFKGLRFAHAIDAYFEEKIRLIADKVSTNSSLLIDRAVRLGIPRDRIVFVPQGCDTEYVQDVDVKVARKRLGLPMNRPLVGTVIDLYWQESLNVFAQVLTAVPTAQLLVIGRKQSGLKEYADRLGISVIETGWVSDEDYPFYLASADVLFLVMKKGLYDLGRWPGKIGDYLAAGRAVVIPDVGDAADFIKEHNAGCVVRDIQSMSGQIARLLQNEEERVFYGKRARDVATHHLDWRVFGDLINRVVLD